jgi:hypothetical protein
LSIYIYIFHMALQLIHEVFEIAHNDAPQSVGLLWTSDQSVAQTSTWQHTTLTTDRHAPVGFEPTISADKRPQTHALDRAVNGTDLYIYVMKTAGLAM